MQAQDTIFREKIARIFDEDSGAMVMGILNVTTDSFFDGGRYVTDDNILEQAKKMVLEGVDIIDIGGYLVHAISRRHQDHIIYTRIAKAPEQDIDSLITAVP